MLNHGYWNSLLDSSPNVKLQNLVSFITTLHLTSTNLKYSDLPKQFKRLQSIAH